MLPIFIGILWLVFLAFFHNAVLMGITRVVPRNDKGKHFVSVAVFSGLALAHIIEIVMSAYYLSLVEQQFWPGSMGGTFKDAFQDWVYFAGINFATLGYTSMDISGDFRIVTMMLSLAGFMLITWSATYLYSACGKYWKD